MTHVEIAKSLLFVREKSNQNDGNWVEAILRTVGLGRGSPWCAAFVSFCLMIAFAGKNPLPNTASCEELHQYAITHGLIEEYPAPGDVFLVLNVEGRAHHTGFVSELSSGGRAQFGTVEGNTNPAGGREGYGVFERHRPFNAGRYRFVRVVRA